MFKNSFSFNGRIRRTEFGLSLIIYVILLSIISLFNKSVSPHFSFLIIPLLWFNCAQRAKRCHDVGNSGWFQLIPFYSLWLLFQEGYPGPNKYGDDPKRRINQYVNDFTKETNNKVIEQKKDVIFQRDNGQQEYDKAMSFYNGTNDIAEQSFSKAVIHLKEASAKGHAPAKEVLATCFYNGDGVEQSNTEAIKLWKELATEGNANAQYNLGLAYYQGKVVPKDNETAISFLRSSCGNFNDSACSLLNRIKKESESNI